MGKRDKSPEALMTGLVFTIGFGIALVYTESWWFIFPMMFAGVLPVVKGIQGMLSAARERRGSPIEDEASAEKEILRLAKGEGGKVTPALIALHTSLSTDRAEEILQKMVKKNYAVMQITEDGRIVYEFPEFNTRIEGSSH